MATSAVSLTSSSLTQVVSELHAKQNQAQETLAKVNEEMAQFFKAQEGATGANKATFEQCNERLRKLLAASKELDQCAQAHFDAHQLLRQERINSASSPILRPNIPTIPPHVPNQGARLNLLPGSATSTSTISLNTSSSFATNPGPRLSLLPGPTTSTSNPAPLRLNPEGNSSGRLSLSAVYNPGARLSLLPSTTSTSTSNTTPLRLNPEGNPSGRLSLNTANPRPGARLSLFPHPSNPT